jgi:Uma2 family endonuclease
MRKTIGLARSMPAMLVKDCQLTIDEFLSMVETRPDGEKWELIEGIAIMNPSPTEWHQQVVANIVTQLSIHKGAKNAVWSVLPGVSTRVPASPGSLPRPDVYVKDGEATSAHTTDNAIILFEVLSRSNDRSDRTWRKRVYSSVPNCQHYVTVATKTAEVIRHDRAGNWAEVKMTGLDATLELSTIDVTMPLRDIYRWTPIE